MAERRMFSRTVVETDVFMDMPLSAQALYFHLGLFADDDGFVNNPTTVQRMIGASKDDLRILISKGFLIVFESGVVVITHWGMSNAVRKDRHKDTIYQKEMAMLTQDSNDMYLLKGDNQVTTICQPNDNQVTTNGCPRLGKDRLGKGRLGKGRLGNTICSERSETAHDPEADVEAIILNDGSEWRPSQSDLEEFIRLFPAVDVVSEFRKMRSWCKNNPTRRKTKNGVKRFVNGWLSREQDRGRPAAASSGNSADEILREMIQNDETGNG